MLGMVGMIERIGMMGRGGIMMERVVTMGGVGMIKEFCIKFCIKTIKYRSYHMFKC